MNSSKDMKDDSRNKRKGMLIRTKKCGYPFS